MIGVRGGRGEGEPPFKNAVRARRMEISCQLKLIRNEQVPNDKIRGTHFFAIWSEKYQICWAPALSAFLADPGRAGLSSAVLGRARSNCAELGWPSLNIKDIDCWPSSAELDGARPAVKILCIFLIFQRIPGQPGTSQKPPFFCEYFLNVAT